MRSFNLAAVLMDETFEGYQDTTELATQWVEYDPGNKATLTLAQDPYSSQGQRQHPLLTISGAASVVGIRGTTARGMGIYINGDAVTQVAYVLSFRYRASAGLAGCTVRMDYSHSAFGGFISAVATCDDQWHTVTGSITDFPESSLAGGLTVSASSVPAAGTLRFDDITITRASALARAIDSTAPVAAFRWNGDGGFRETLRYLTPIHTARDGTEHREQLRVIPRWRVEYETRCSTPAETSRVDQWLYAHHGQRVAVPRWVDQLTFAGLGSPTTVVFLSGGTTTDRAYYPLQRVMLWDSPARYETAVISLVDTGFIQLTGALSMVFTAGSTKVVPLLPARLDQQMTLGRPNPSLGIVPLAFDIEVVQ